MLPGAFHTTRLLLRPIAPEDAGPIFDSYAQEVETTRFLTWRPHRNVGDTAAYIARCIAMSPRIARTYVVCEAGAIRGALGLRLDDPYRLEVGYVLARSCWGAGLITEALREVAPFATSRMPTACKSWNKQALSARRCCAGGRSIRISAPSPATATATLGCADTGEHIRWNALAMVWDRS
jgi:RimJ/RimL family protein N-acetyltransferase